MALRLSTTILASLLAFLLEVSLDHIFAQVLQDCHLIDRQHLASPPVNLYQFAHIARVNVNRLSGQTRCLRRPLHPAVVHKEEVPDEGIDSPVVNIDS